MPVDQMSNWRDLIPGSTTPTFAAAYYFPFGIVYRPDLVPGGKITSWEELWGPGFANKIAAPTVPVFQGRMPDETPSHPYEPALESAMLAPKAEMTFYPWKDTKEKIPLAVRHVRTFLRANRPA